MLHSLELAIGVTGVDTPTKTNLLGDAIDGKTFADVDTVAEVQALADAAAAVMTGVGAGAGGGGAETMGVGLAAGAAGCPGAVQPGGGTNALLGSAERTGGIAAGGASADAITIGAGATGAGARITSTGRSQGRSTPTHSARKPGESIAFCELLPVKTPKPSNAKLPSSSNTARKRQPFMLLHLFVPNDNQAPGP